MSEAVLHQRTLCRPRIRYGDGGKTPICPFCGVDVDDTLGAPPIPTMRLGDQRPTHVDGDRINVRGYLCERGQYVLAIAPEHVTVDLEETWTTTVAGFATGDPKAIVVPANQITGGY